MSRVKLGDVAREYKATVKDASGLPIVGLEHLTPGEITLDRWDEGTENTFTKEFKKGQMLFGRRRAYLKKAALAPFDGVCSGDITVIEAIPGKILPDLLPFIIQNDLLFDYAVGKSAGSLSPRVKWIDLKDYEFELPEISKQAPMVELLQAAHAARKAYKELIQATDDLVKSQFIEIIEHALPSSYVELSEVLTQYRTTEKIVDTRAEKYISVPLYGRGITERDIGNDDIKSFTGIRIKTGQFIYSRIWARKGASGIVPPELNGAVVTNEFPVFDINTAKIDPCFLLFSVQDERFLQQISVNSLGSTSKQRIKESAFLKYKICLPPIAVQSAFSAMVEQSDKSKFELQQAIDRIDNLIKTLIQQ